MYAAPILVDLPANSLPINLYPYDFDFAFDLEQFLSSFYLPVS